MPACWPVPLKKVTAFFSLDCMSLGAEAILQQTLECNVCANTVVGNVGAGAVAVIVHICLNLTFLLFISWTMTCVVKFNFNNTFLNIYMYHICTTYGHRLLSLSRSLALFFI